MRNALRSAHQLITAAIDQLDTVDDAEIADVAEELRIAISRVERVFGRITITLPDTDRLAALIPDGEVAR